MQGSLMDGNLYGFIGTNAIIYAAYLTLIQFSH